MGIGAPVPADDEAVLRLQKVRPFIEVDQVVRVALEPMLVVFVLAAGELNELVAELPALQLAVISVTMAEDLGHPLDQLHGVLVDAAQDQAALVGGERKAEPEIGLSTAGLPAVEEFVGLAGEGL